MTEAGDAKLVTTHNYEANGHSVEMPVYELGSGIKVISALPGEIIFESIGEEAEEFSLPGNLGLSDLLNIVEYSFDSNVVDLVKFQRPILTKDAFNFLTSILESLDKKTLLITSQEVAIACRGTDFAGRVVALRPLNVVKGEGGVRPQQFSQVIFNT